MINPIIEIIAGIDSNLTLIEIIGFLTVIPKIEIPKIESDFITFLDGDDLWQPTKSEKQIHFLNEHPNCDVVCCSVLTFTKAYGDNKQYKSTREFNPSRLFGASTFRRDTFIKFGILDSTAGHFGWMYDWWSKADDSGIRFGTIDEILFHRRIHETNSWIKNKKLADKTVIEIIRRNIKRRRSND